MSDINVEKLRVGPGLAQQVLDQQKQARKAKRGAWRRSYTLLPRVWELKLLETNRVATWRLALELLYLHWQSKGQPVVVTGKMVTDLGLSVRSKSRVLAELAEFSLITIERDGSKSPRVTLRFVEAA